MKSTKVSDKEKLEASKGPDIQPNQNVQPKGPDGPMILRGSGTDIDSLLLTNMGSIDSIKTLSSSLLKVDSNPDNDEVEIGGDSSILSVDGRSRKVRFRDEKPPSALQGETSSHSIQLGLVDVAYFETLMKAKHPWEDANYLSGFTDLFPVDEIRISDITCFPCSVDSTYEIHGKDNKLLFYVEKVQETWMTWLKFLCLKPFRRARNGFIITILSPKQTMLAKFVRKNHCHAKQMDIVETFHTKEEVYIGRIEKTRHGFLIRDREHEDIYRLIHYLPSKTNTYHLSDRKQELRIFRTDNKEVVGRVVYIERGFFMDCLSPFTKLPTFVILCNPDVGTNAKVLIIGAVFLQLHSNEKYIDLPLGNDSVHFQEGPDPPKDSTSSIELLLAPFTYST